MTHSAEIEVKTIPGWREWLVFERRDGHISVGIENCHDRRPERRRDPESGITIDDADLQAVIEILQAMLSESVALVRCWRCKHDVPEATTVCNAGVGTQCQDQKACRGRSHEPAGRPK